MVKFLKDLLLGEPVLATGIVSTGLASALAVMIDPPLWLHIVTPIWIAAATFYQRQNSSPMRPSS